MTITPAAPRVVVIGGGYVGAPLARALDKIADVTLIDRLPVFFHRMAALRAAVDPDATDLPFLSRDNLLRNGRTITAEVVALRPDEHIVELADGRTIDYDVAVIATGSPNQDITRFAGTDTSEAREHFATFQREIAEQPAVAVIGGGITGVELVGEITDTHPGKQVVLITRRGVTPDLPPKAVAKLTAQLEARGVRILTDQDVRTDDVESALRRAGLDPSQTAVIWTTGGRPEVEWLRASHPQFVSDDGILVDEYLRVGGRDDLFSVGDVAATKGIKGAMNARTQTPVIVANVAARGPAKKWEAKGPRIALVPLGRDGGIVSVGIGGADLLLGPGAARTAKGRTLMTPMMEKSLGNA